jgi:hypothetical protein
LHPWRQLAKASTVRTQHTLALLPHPPPWQHHPPTRGCCFWLLCCCAGDLRETDAFLLATSRRSDTVSLSHHHSMPFPLCGGIWQLRLTVDSGSEADDAVPRVGVHAILVEPHRRAAGPTSANFTLKLHAEQEPPTADVWNEYQHVGRSFGVGAG